MVSSVTTRKGRGVSLTFGSLFSGVGGFDLGFERAGLVCKWQVEIDDFATRCLEAHWPHVARFRDVREWSCNRPEHAVDVVCGGWPCQDLSVAGKRAGLAGERSRLFHEFVRVVSELRPAWVVGENVPGLLSSSGGRDMETIINLLGDIGYCVCWRVLDARFFGVPQRRRRVFFVCHSDPRRAAAVLFESEGGSGNPAKMRESRADVARCVGEITGGVSGKEQQQTLSPTLRVRGTPLVAVCIDASYGDKWGSNQWVDQGHAIQCAPPHSDGMRAVSGLPGSLDVFACETCAEGPDGPRYKVIGNAVVPQVAEWIGRRIVEACG